jgi:nanoRNase/pAp phosphatase (c-di-AMP/oligoRNAs hydrolase)
MEAAPTISAVRSPAEQLLKLLDEHRGETHCIAIRGYPDPDSIGAAMAHAYLSHLHEIDATIMYFDDISHQENRALVKKLAIEMVRYSKDTAVSHFDAVVLVDTQYTELPRAFAEIPILSIVDHHKTQDVHAKFVDVREDSGSTCSIYAEYLEDVVGEMEQDDSAVAKMASAMLYGIRTDTDDYLFARDIDYRAAAFLAPYVDRDLLLAISRQAVSPRTMEITQKAYANKVISDTFLVSGVGFVRDEDRDGIGQAADYLLQREGIDTVLCYGIVNHDVVDGSLRTTSNVVDPDLFLRELLGADEAGRYFGGGRADKGAFKIPLGPFSRCGDRELLWKMVQRTIEDLFVSKVGTADE